MKVTTGVRYILALPLLLLFFVPTVHAQDSTPLEESPFSPQELDSMLAPIALYPDALLSHILMAATYPLEIVEAARWSRANPHLKGQEAVRAVEDRDWDPSVKSLVAFPQILERMDEKLRWTEGLGNAFLAQQPQVMSTVQRLRQKAEAAGHLNSHEHYRVAHRDRVIVIESPYPDVVYVPYYSPLVVYGSWWWPGHPPVYWKPWPHYHAHHRYPSFHWSVGIFIGPRFFFGISDWRHHHVLVAPAYPFYYRPPHYRPVHHQHVHIWHHDPHHRRGVVYRHPAHKHYVRVDGAYQGQRAYRVDAPRGSVEHREFVHRTSTHPRHIERSESSRRHWQSSSRAEARTNAPAKPNWHGTARAQAQPDSNERRWEDRRREELPATRAEGNANRPGVTLRRDSPMPAGHAPPAAVEAARRGNMPPRMSGVPRSDASAAARARPAPQPRLHNGGDRAGREDSFARRHGSGSRSRVPEARGAPAPRVAGRAFASAPSAGSHRFGEFRQR